MNFKITVFPFIRKLDRPHENAENGNCVIRRSIGDHFYEYAQGRGGHGHASESK